MQLPGLITVKPEQTDVIDQLAYSMGESFLEEAWTQSWLESLDVLQVDKERKLEISRAIMKCDFTVGAPYECCYMLPDMSAGAGGYLSSDLQGQSWNDLEDKATDLMIRTALSEKEATLLYHRAEEMKPISNFRWCIDHAQGNDFIHFFSLGVNPRLRGSGIFRKLITPFLDYADKQGLTCYLECYRKHLEGLYGHFGFKTICCFSDPAFDIIERAMVREPRL